MAEVPKIPIKLPVWHYKRLLIWAAAKDQSRTAMMSNTLQARIEHNEDQILSMGRSLARDKGLSFEQFCLNLWAENGLENVAFDLDDTDSKDS